MANNIFEEFENLKENRKKLSVHTCKGDETENECFSFFVPNFPLLSHVLNLLKQAVLILNTFLFLQQTT
jgi:hypothetical protein